MADLFALFIDSKKLSIHKTLASIDFSSEVFNLSLVYKCPLARFLTSEYIPRNLWQLLAAAQRGRPLASIMKLIFVLATLSFSMLVLAMPREPIEVDSEASGQSCSEITGGATLCTYNDIPGGAKCHQTIGYTMCSNGANQDAAVRLVPQLGRLPYPMYKDG